MFGRMEVTMSYAWLGLWVLLLCTQMWFCLPAHSQSFHWFDIRPSPTRLRAVPFLDGALMMTDSVLWVTKNGQRAMPLFDRSDTVHPSKDGYIVPLLDGQILALLAGTSGTTQAVLCNSDGSVRILTANERPAVSLAVPNDHAIFDDGTMRVGFSFSSSPGTSWQRILQTPETRLDKRYIVSLRDSLYAFRSVAPQAWYTIDRSTGAVLASSWISPQYCAAALRRTGQGFAVVYSETGDVETALVSLQNGGPRNVARVHDDRGVSIPIPNDIGYSQRILVALDTPYYVLDSGMVAEHQGDTIVVLPITDDDTIRRMGTLVARPRLISSNGTYQLIYSCLDNQRAGRTFRIVHWKPGTEAIVVRSLSAEPAYVALDGRASAGNKLVLANEQTLRPWYAAERSSGYRQGQPLLRWMGFCDTTVLCATEYGDIMHVDGDRLPLFLSQQIPSEEGVLEHERILFRCAPTTQGSLLSVPNVVSSHVDVHQSMIPISSRMGHDGIPTVFGRTTDGRTFHGRFSLHVSDGDVVAVHRFPDTLVAPDVPMSSVVFFGTDTIIVAFRGFSVGYSATDRFTARTGYGMLRTTNAGTSWEPFALPSGDTWVESLTITPEGGLAAWSTTMRLDVSFGTPAAPQVRQLSTRLWYGSSVGGWSQRWLDTIPSPGRIADVHAWPIAFTRDRLWLVSQPSTALVGGQAGFGWSVVSGLPDDATIGGLAVAPDGAWWFATSDGVHAIAPQRPTSVRTIAEDNHERLTVAPQPATGEVWLWLGEHPLEEGQARISTVTGEIIEAGDIRGGYLRLPEAIRGSGAYRIVVATKGITLRAPLIVMPK